MLPIFGDRLFATAIRFHVYKCQNDYLFMNYLLITKNYC